LGGSVGFRAFRDGIKTGEGTSVLDSGQQTTTSWRTGNGFPSDEAEYNAKSGTDLAKSVGSEYRSRNDTGHPFRTDKTTVTHETVGVSWSCNYFGSRYTADGYIIPQLGAWSAWPTIAVASESDLDSVGRHAISLTAPTQSEAALAQFLGELREGLPKLTGLQTLKGGVNAKTLHRDLADEHLNLQFGTVPLIRDIEAMARGVLDFHEKTRQFRRDSDRSIRRGVTLRDDTQVIIREASRSGAPTMSGGLPNGLDPRTVFYLNTGRYNVVDTTSTKQWFKGAFTYHVAEAHSFLGKMDEYEQLANHLLGSRITVSTLWELTPWSWLVDWFADVGTFVQNVSLLHDDSLVLRYGYVMSEQSVTRRHTQSGMVPRGTGPTACSRVVSVTTKQRRKATPYGFGVDLQSLSPRRWSILGALGLTRGPRTLRTD